MRNVVEIDRIEIEAVDANLLPVFFPLAVSSVGTSRCLRGGHDSADGSKLPVGVMEHRIARSDLGHVLPVRGAVAGLVLEWCPQVPAISSPLVGRALVHPPIPVLG